MRDEKLNVGIAIVGEHLDIRSGRNLDKLKAISHALSTSVIRGSLEALKDLDLALKLPHDTIGSRLERVSKLTGLEFVSFGKFEAASTAAYEEYVHHLMATLVEPEPAIRNRTSRKYKLSNSLRIELHNRRILAQDGEDLSSHRVVRNWKIDEGLSADFALKNGSLHLINTVDAHADSARLKRVVQDIAVSCLVLETARVSYGRENVRGRIIYYANSHVENVALPSLETAAYQGAELVNWASAESRRQFIDKLSDLAAPLPLLEMSSGRAINASIQHKSHLN